MCIEVACHPSLSLRKQKALYCSLSLTSAQLCISLHKSFLLMNKVRHSEENGRAGFQVTALVSSPLCLSFISTEPHVPITTLSLSILLLRNRNISKTLKSYSKCKPLPSHKVTGRFWYHLLPFSLQLLFYYIDIAQDKHTNKIKGAPKNVHTRKIYIHTEISIPDNRNYLEVRRKPKTKTK